MFDAWTHFKDRGLQRRLADWSKSEYKGLSFENLFYITIAEDKECFFKRGKKFIHENVVELSD